MRNAQGALIGDYRPYVAPLGSGGFCCGIDLKVKNGDVKALSAHDVCTGYRRIFDPTVREWEPTFRADTLPSAIYEPSLPAPASAKFPNENANTNNNKGTFCAVMAPGNPDYEVHQWRNEVYKSVNGEDLTLCPGFRVQTALSNTGSWRTIQDTIAISHANQDHWLVGTNNDGVHATTDGGDTANEVASIPAASGSGVTGNVNSVQFAKHLVACDPTDATGNTWYATSFGNGLYRSTTGVAGPYSQVTGASGTMPLTADNLRICPTTGDVWVCRSRWEPDGSFLTGTEMVYVYDKSADSWSTLTGLTEHSYIAIDPNDPDRLVIGNENGRMVLSYDRGVTLHYKREANNATPDIFRDSEGEIA